eukprot:5611886-Prorocentrum_lima.AAC.1
MTSSLVGSEMCIRDRWMSGGVRAVRWAGRGPSDRGTKSGGGGKSVFAVSYTHLTLPTICSV